MSTKTILIVLAALILGGLAWYIFAPRPATAPTDTASTEESSLTEESVPYDALVTYTGAGFTPENLVIKAGDTVRFTNASESGGMWVGADEHPTHTEFDGTSTREHCVDGAAVGGSFDMCHAARAGESWDFTFAEAGTYGYHNHTSARATGTIVVE